MHTYNLFRRKDETDLCCAVPVTVPVPSFLTQTGWEYTRSLDIRTLSGFDAAAAQMSVGANGFYLFHRAS